jgi:protein-disulfide isomerase
MTINPKANRRHILLGASSLALMPGLAFAQAIDLKELNAAPAHGEMAQGPETAKVTIIEYASSSCPHCAQFFKDVYTPLKKDYIDTGKVRFVLREFPHNDLGMAGFMLARCAPKEKYFPIVDVLFSTQDKWLADPLNSLKEIAKQAGMTEADFDACLKNQKVANDINAVRLKAETFGVDSIPTIFINGVKYDNDNTYEKFKAEIDKLLAS